MPASDVFEYDRLAAIYDVFDPAGRHSELVGDLLERETVDQFPTHDLAVTFPEDIQINQPRDVLRRDAAVPVFVRVPLHGLFFRVALPLAPPLRVLRRIRTVCPVVNFRVVVANNIHSFPVLLDLI